MRSIISTSFIDNDLHIAFKFFHLFFPNQFIIYTKNKSPLSVNCHGKTFLLQLIVGFLYCKSADFQFSCQAANRGQSLLRLQFAGSDGLFDRFDDLFIDRNH